MASQFNGRPVEYCPDPGLNFRAHFGPIFSQFSNFFDSSEQMMYPKLKSLDQDSFTLVYQLYITDSILVLTALWFFSLLSRRNGYLRTAGMINYPPKYSVGCNYSCLLLAANSANTYIVIFPNFESYAASEINKNTCYDYNMYILYLGSLNDEYTISCSSILWNAKSILGYMTIFASRCDNQHPFSRKWNDDQVWVSLSWTEKITGGTWEHNAIFTTPEASSRDKKLKLLAT